MAGIYLTLLLLVLGPALLVHFRTRVRERRLAARLEQQEYALEQQRRRLDALERQLASAAMPELPLAARTAEVAATGVAAPAMLADVAPARVDTLVAAEAPPAVSPAREQPEPHPQQSEPGADRRAVRSFRDFFGLDTGSAGGATAAATAAPASVTTAASSLELAPALERGPDEPGAWAARRRDFEQRFMANWTGVLGAMVVVAGITFVGIYTAVRLPPFQRFLMTLAASGALLAASWLLGRRASWHALAGWVRSAGAAVLLLACAGAGGLPGLGLQWVADPWAALALLVVGIGANLALAAASAQAASTLHVLLSLLPLAIVPPSAVSFALASVVTGSGVVLAARGRRDRQLAWVLGAYVAFQASWILRFGSTFTLDVARQLAAACAAAVFGIAALAHYRRDFARPKPSPLQLGVHVANWGALAFALAVYVPSPAVRSLALLAAAALAARLAARAGALRVEWLRRTDVLAAQALVVLALLGLLELQDLASLALLLVLAETLAFRRVVSRNDALLDRVATALPLLAALGLACAGLYDLRQGPDAGIPLAALQVVGAGLAVLGATLLQRRPAAASVDDVATAGATASVADERTAERALAALAGALVLVGLTAIADRPWLELAALGATGTLCWVAVRTRVSSHAAIGAGIALAGAHVLAWVAWSGARDWAPVPLLVRAAPLLALAGLAAYLLPARLRSLAITLLGITVGATAFLWLDPRSALAPAVAWLALSLVALELAQRFPREARTLLALGYAYLAAFVAAYVLVVMQVPAYVGALNARLLIEAFGLGVLAYWWFFRPVAAIASLRTWGNVHPWFFELLLVGAVVTVVVEVPAQWWAAAWALFALALVAPSTARGFDERAGTYSLLFYWASIVDMAVVLGTWRAGVLGAWHAQPWFTSLVAIALQVAYAVASHRALTLADTRLPPTHAALAWLGARVAKRRNLYVYHPLFAGVALFLYWRFDRSLLTLLWATEAFAVFALSAWLRENQFRYVALAGLAACLARLVFVDLAEANLALRGAVFIGVGLLMLGMNAIYNRYRGRFDA